MSNLISVCMIVKNEEEVLSRCLDSIGGLWDELIIVDTGSTDRTIEIANSYGAKVLRYEWVYPGNKGEARNMGIDAATGDWIVVVDADEVILHPKVLREALSLASKDINGINVHFVNIGASERVDLQWYQMRIFRRGEYRYIHREHEIPVASKEAMIGTMDTTFEHRPPLDRYAPKISTMLERLKLDVVEHPDDPHSLYMLARQYGHAEQYQEAIEAVEKYLTLPTANTKSDAARLAGICWLRVSQRHKAYEWFHRATAYEPARRLLWIELAQMYFDDGQFALAYALARMAADLPLIQYQRETLPAEQLIYICYFIEQCQHEISHAMAHSHTH